MSNSGVLVIGGGIAGLVAARLLAKGGMEVTLIEGRDRLGGRILTQKLGNGTPVDLGAEFIHGAKAVTWELLRESGLETHEVPDRHWKPGKDGCLAEDPGFWSKLEKVMEFLEDTPDDVDFLSVLRNMSVSQEERKLALSYVEGFHAAHPEKISICSLLRAEQSSQKDEGQRQFRINKGYSALVDWLLAELQKSGVRALTGHLVRRVQWSRNSVKVFSRGNVFQSTRCLCALPAGVISDASAGVEFEPELPEKRLAASTIQSGNVAKIVLEFSHRFWPVENFGFAHDPDLEFQACWADERGEVLTAWAGGPKAEALLSAGPEEIISRALSNLGRMFRQSKGDLQRVLKSHHHYDWLADPLSRAAYSYVPAGALKEPGRLAEPVANTLFFAGEATVSDGRNGTVHGAIQSAKRAAEQILQANGR